MVLKIEKSCLVIIDMQEEIFPKMFDTKSLLKSTTQLLQIASLLHIPTVITEQNSKGLGSTIYEVVSLVSGASVIDKTTFSAYGSEAFVNRMELFKNDGITDVVIAGIESHICVTQTAFDLKENGFTPYIVSDCCSSRLAYSKQVAERRMRTSGIDIVNTEMVGFEWIKDSKHPRFKEVLNIIK